MKPNRNGTKEYLLAQLIGIVEEFLKTDKIKIIPESFGDDELRKRILYTLNMNKIVQHVWEATEAFELDRNENVAAWAKNDHLGFFISYTYEGVLHKFYPDFLLRLKNGLRLVLETKGRDSQKDKTKREFLDEWVKAVNTHGGFGKWKWAVSTHPRDVEGIIRNV